MLPQDFLLSLIYINNLHKDPYLLCSNNMQQRILINGLRSTTTESICFKGARAQKIRLKSTYLKI